MLLALLSDTHDNPVTTMAALELLKPHGPDAYLHAGDLVAPEMLDLFKGLPFHFVFGNNEYDLPALRSRAKALDLHCHNYFADLSFSGKRIALLHGHDHPLMARLLKPPPETLPNARPFDYIIHGHTHVRRDDRQGHSRIINPGALQRARSKSLALLDLATDSLTFLEI
jgi:putative phosphoesterase